MGLVFSRPVAPLSRATVPCAGRVPIPGLELARSGGTPAGSVAASLSFDFTAEASGTTLTSAILELRKLGGTGYTFGTTCGASHGTGTPNRTTIVTDATAPLYADPFSEIFIDGEAFAGSTKVIQHSLVDRTGNDSKWERFDINATAAPITTNISGCCFVHITLDGGAAQVYLDLFRTGGIAGFGVFQAFINSGLSTIIARVHSDDGAAYGTGVTITPDWYRLDWRLDFTSGYMEIMLRHKTTGAVIVAERIATGAVSYSTTTFGTELQTYTGTIKIAHPVYAFGGASRFPMEATFTPTAPSAVTLELSAANTITGTITSVPVFSRKVERNKNSAGWTTIESALTASTFTDTDVIVGDTVQYRVTNQINAHSSSATASASYEVETFVIPTADLHFWLEGDSGVENSSGVAATNGQTVQFWRDKSGNGRDFVQNTAGARPTLDTTGINNLPTVIGDGTDDFMTYANTADIAHLFVVASERSTADQFQGLLGIKDSSSAAGDYDAVLITTGDVGTKSSVRCGLGTGATFTGSVSGAGVIVANTPFLLEVRMDRTTGMVLDSYVNGVSVGQGSSATAALPCGIVTLFSSYWQGNITDFGPFDIAAVVAYTAVQSSTKVDQIEAYLNTKYIP